MFTSPVTGGPTTVLSPSCPSEIHLAHSAVSVNDYPPREPTALDPPLCLANLLHQCPGHSPGPSPPTWSSRQPCQLPGFPLPTHGRCGLLKPKLSEKPQLKPAGGFPSHQSKTEAHSAQQMTCGAWCQACQHYLLVATMPALLCHCASLFVCPHGPSCLPVSTLGLVRAGLLCV